MRCRILLLAIVSFALSLAGPRAFGQSAVAPMNLAEADSGLAAAESPAAGEGVEGRITDGLAQAPSVLTPEPAPQAIPGLPAPPVAPAAPVAPIAPASPAAPAALTKADCTSYEPACEAYGFRFFGDYLYLQARDVKVPYAVEVNSDLPPTQTPIQTSKIARLDPDYSSGFRIGGGVCLDECSELVATFSYYGVGTNDSITRVSDAQQVVPMVAHSSTLDANAGTVSAAAHMDIQFHTLDLDYRQLLLRNERTDLYYVIGARYADLQQKFQARTSDDLASGLNSAEWASDVNFTGGGVRLGLDAEQYARRCHMLFYAKGYVSLLAGEFDANYTQTVQNNSRAGVDTGISAGRIVPVCDLEIGAGFYGPCGKWRATVGYLFNSWSNVVTLRDMVDAVQVNNFDSMKSTVTFDGVVARVEGRF